MKYWIIWHTGVGRSHTCTRAVPLASCQNTVKCDLPQSHQLKTSTKQRHARKLPRPSTLLLRPNGTQQGKEEQPSKNDRKALSDVKNAPGANTHVVPWQ